MNSRPRSLHIGNGRVFRIRTIADAFLKQGHKIQTGPRSSVEEGWEEVTWQRCLTCRACRMRRR